MGRRRSRAPSPVPRLPPIAVLLACAFLIGCTEMQGQLSHDLAVLVGPPQKHFEGVPAHGAAPADDPAPPSAASAGPPAAQSATPPAAHASVTAASATAPAAAGGRGGLRDVRDLIGLEPRELQDRLGEPALLRRDAPAEIWQYRSALCVLDLFLYRDGAATRVTNAELRPRDGRDLPAATCLSSL